MTPDLLTPGGIGARRDLPAPGRPRPDGSEIEAVAAAVRSILGEWARGAQRQRDGGPVFAERLLSLRHAEALPAGAREVRLAPGTVVTPLARDFLKRRGVAVRFVATAEVERVKNQGEWGFAAESDSGVVAALRRALLDGPDLWEELDSFEDVTRWVVEGPGRGALLLTDEASVAVWRACQVAGIRAAAAETCEAVDRATRRLGVNLLVVEPSGKSIAFLKQLGRTLRRGGAPEAPAGLGLFGGA